MEQILRKYRIKRLFRFSARDTDEPRAAAQYRLEDLPPELKLALLRSFDNLVDLQSLVHASPLYHAVYLENQSCIVQRVLLDGLDEYQYILIIGGILDIPTDRPEVLGDLIPFLKTNDAIDIPPACNSHIIFSGHGTNLARIQLSVQFAIHDFCTSALSKNPATGKYVEDDALLSLTEHARISRAFYRYQVFCTVFRGPEEHYRSIFDRFDFLGLFSPWEVEEIACVRK